MTYIQGMLEKKLNDSLKKIRDKKIEGKYFKKYRKLENFSLKGISRIRTTTASKFSGRSKKPGMIKSSSHFGLRKPKSRRSSNHKYRLLSGRLHTMSQKTIPNKLKSGNIKSSMRKKKGNFITKIVPNIHHRKGKLSLGTASRNSSKANLSEQFNVSKYTGITTEKVFIGMNHAKEIADIAQNNFTEIPEKTLTAIDSLFDGKFSFLEFFSEEFFDDGFHRRCEKERKWVKDKKKESRDEVIKNYRKWIRLLVFFRLHKLEPCLKRYVNIFYVLHMTKMK